MKKFQNHETLLHIFFALLFYTNFLFSNSQILNNVIRLGDNPYIYNHFSHNEKSDLIIDTESNPKTNVRLFFGMKKNGKEYYIDNKGNKNYHFSITAEYKEGRVESESCFIKVKSDILNLNRKELLLGISKIGLYNYKTEFYDLNDVNDLRIFNYSIIDLFGIIRSNVFAIIPDPLNTDNSFNYFISYILEYDKSKYKLYTIKAEFYMDNVTYIRMDKENKDEIVAIYQAIISCFFTKNYLYICFYTNINLELTIRVYDSKSNKSEETHIYKYSKQKYRRFYKGIHLKDEIGFFAYYKDDGDKPYFSLYQINSDKTAQKYKSYNEIVSNGAFYSEKNDMFNDLIKLRDNLICFAGTSFDKKEIYLILFSFYSSYDFMNVRYYTIKIYEENSYIIHEHIRLGLFNNVLLLAFSQCDKDMCDSFHLLILVL